MSTESFLATTTSIFTAPPNEQRFWLGLWFANVKASNSLDYRVKVIPREEHPSLYEFLRWKQSVHRASILTESADPILFQTLWDE